jgi:tetratricopeptide (TPR) repeat protein
LGQHKAAAGAYRAALTLQDSGRNPERYIETLTALARAEAAHEAYQGAVAAYHEALQFSSLSPALRQKLLSEQGAAYERLNQTRPAIKAYTAALTLETGTPTERAALHRALAALYMGIGEHAGAQTHLEAAIAAMGEMGDDADGPMLRSLGDTYRALDRPADALDAYRRARARTDPVTDPLGRAAIEAALGAVLVESERYLEAISHFEAALELRRTHAPRETAYTVDLLSRLAEAHEKRGELERATTRLHESLVYLDERTAPEAVIETLNRLGGLYMELRRPAEAAKAYEEGLRAEGRAVNANPARIDAMTFGLGRAKQALGQLESAAELYRSAANSPRQTPAREGARMALKAAEAEIARHMQTLDVAEQSWAVLSRSAKPDFKGLAFVMALQAQTLAALGRREAADHRVEQMLELLAARRRELPASGEDAAPLAILIRGWELECNGQKEAAAAEYRAALVAALRAPGANTAFLWALRQKATPAKA